MPTTFEDFKRMFLEHYSLLDDTKVARAELRKLKQCGAIQDYITAFNNIVLSLPELPEVDQVHAFVYGLKPYIRKFV